MIDRAAAEIHYLWDRFRFHTDSCNPGFSGEW